MNTLKIVTTIGALVSVISVNGGWTTVKFMDDGKTSKVRNSTLRDLTAEELALHKTAAKGIKPGKAEKPAKVEKPAKEAKTPKAKRDPVSAKPESGDVLTGDGAALVTTEKLVNPDYDRYIKHDVKSPSGRKALDIDDEAAKLLRGQDIADCYFIVAKNLVKVNGGDVDTLEKELHAQYTHLNIGMQRMNLGNRLRKALGTYGNRNAHKSTVTQDGMPETQAQKDEAIAFGKRATDKLKRATDPA